MCAWVLCVVQCIGIKPWLFVGVLGGHIIVIAIIIIVVVAVGGILRTSVFFFLGSDAFIHFVCIPS